MQGLACRGQQSVLEVTRGSVEWVGEVRDALMSVLLVSCGAMLSCFLGGPGWGGRGIVIVLGGRSGIWSWGPDGRGA